MMAMLNKRGYLMECSEKSQKEDEITASDRLNPASQTNFSAYFSLENNPLIDIISPKYHSSDFNQTRANYISGRLWLMCLFFAVTVPLFSLFDFVILPSEQAQNLLFARGTLSVALFLVAYILKQQPSIILLRGCMLLAFFLPTLFYLYTMVNFASSEQTNAPLIYSMMPYLIIAMLGLFPLTILGGLSLIAVVFLPFASFEFSQFEHNIWPLVNALWLFLLFAGISLWLQTSQLSMLMKLYRESTVDPLTKLINRRVLMRMAEKEQKQCQQYGLSFSVIMFDLDKFKRINDEFGHHVGDQVLLMTANLMKRELDQTDIAARFGGEEFVAILPGASLVEASRVAERISRTLKAESLLLETGDIIRVTTSIGVTQYNANESLEETFKRADDLLYAAKDGGRDRVVSDLTDLAKES